MQSYSYALVGIKAILLTILFLMLGNIVVNIKNHRLFLSNRGIVKPSFINGSQVNLKILIRSSVKNSIHRSFIRQTSMSVLSMLHRHMDLKFIVGRPKSLDVMVSIWREIDEHNDLLLCGHNDEVKSMTEKTERALQYCSMGTIQALCFITDDTHILLPKEFKEFLGNVRKSIYTGYVVFYQLKKQNFLPYVRGGAILLSADYAELFYLNYHLLKSHSYDARLGILADVFGITPIANNDRFFFYCAANQAHNESQWVDINLHENFLQLAPRYWTRYLTNGEKFNRVKKSDSQVVTLS